MPTSTLAIIKIVHNYMKDVGLHRPHFTNILPNGEEIESKLHIKSPQDVRDILDKIQKLGFSCGEHRSESHYLYQLDNGAHISRIEIAGMNTEWLKMKSKNHAQSTTRYGFPLVRRTSVKLKPRQQGYEQMYGLTQCTPIFANFHKECINLFFTFHDCVFSVSFSLAWNEKGFKREELELEYEGHIDPSGYETTEEVEETMEDMIRYCLPDHRTRKLHTETKYESLDVRISA